MGIIIKPIISEKMTAITESNPQRYAFLVAPTVSYTHLDVYKRQTVLTEEDKPIMSQLGDLTCEKRWMPTTDGGKMLTWVLYPPHFDKNKQYPSILYCQGGPQSTISQFWSYRWNPRIMAEQGYIVILPNRHGVPGFGKAWNEQISGCLLYTSRCV